MTPEAMVTQPIRLAAILAKRNAHEALTEGEYALFLDYEACMLLRALRESPPDLEEAVQILLPEINQPPTIPNAHE